MVSMASPTITHVEPYFETGILLYLSDGSVIELVPVNVDEPDDMHVRDKALAALKTSIKY
jgi:hypothetical protein